MSQPRTFQIATQEQAVAALEYFNAFHDGFIRRIVITSRDSIDDDRGQVCTGTFDVEVDFAHYNYAVEGAAEPEPFHPRDQLVRATFHNVQDVYCDLREAMFSNTIISLDIRPGERQLAAALPVETCLDLTYTRHHLVDGERWETRTYRLLTFTEATFRELTARGD